MKKLIFELKKCEKGTNMSSKSAPKASRKRMQKFNRKKRRHDAQRVELLVGLAACAEAVGGEGEGIGFEIGKSLPHAQHPQGMRRI